MSSPPPAPTPTPSSSTAPTPSGSAPQPKILDAFATIDPVKDLKNLPTMPCARTSLMFGIVAGVSIGAVRFLFARGGAKSQWDTVGVATNWAVGAWGVGSLAAWETCRARQTAEAARMASVVNEIKARQAQARKRPAGAAGEQRIGGVLVGERGKEVIKEKEELEKSKSESKSWWKGWL
ncbi:hypothetical protein MNV49_000110 [Pseudohyphozyma bogoriensis]|nr:hypothetical protein MNV49_000110 [Pseudohyphozyma bogoriensis]